MTTTISTLQAQLKTTAGTGGARALRRTARVPGILYGKNFQPIMFSVDKKELTKELFGGSFFTRLYSLMVDGKAYRAVARDVQWHPLTDHPIHLDFVQVDKGSRLTVSVPLVFVNEDKAPGVKRGGVLNAVLHSVDLSCPVENIPEQITVDLTGLDFHGTVHAQDLKLPEGVTLIGNNDYTVATIVPPTTQTETTEGAEGQPSA